MTTLFVAAEGSLLVVREGSPWSVERYLEGLGPACVAVDRTNGTRIYCGTAGHGLWSSADGGTTWQAVPRLGDAADVTAVAVARAAAARGPRDVYAGTEPSAVFRSSDEGRTWAESDGLRRLGSAATWSFPPRPDTHHVRWIEPDATVPQRVFVAIEAGALVRTLDGGRTWEDRTAGGPYDTHTAATHPLAPDRVYSAAGDGYFESLDAGRTWRRHMEGLRHRYLVGIAVDPADPDTVLVSAAPGPHVAYRPAGAEAFVYRSQGGRAWTTVGDGLPRPAGTTVACFAVDSVERVIYAANNRGLYRSADAGATWSQLDVAWPSGSLSSGVSALAFFSPHR